MRLSDLATWCLRRTKTVSFILHTHHYLPIHRSITTSWRVNRFSYGRVQRRCLASVFGQHWATVWRTCEFGLERCDYYFSGGAICSMSTVAWDIQFFTTHYSSVTSASFWRVMTVWPLYALPSKPKSRRISTRWSVQDQNYNYSAYCQYTSWGSRTKGGCFLVSDSRMISDCF